MIEGLVGLLVMMLLCCLRVPISFSMAIVGHRRLRLHARLELDGRLRDDPDQALRDGTQLHAVGGAVVHPDGQLRHAGRHVAGAVPGRLRLHRPSAGRAGHGHHLGLGRLRRHLRLVHRHRGHLRQGGVSVDEEVRLLRPAGRRRGGGRRHAGHHDPALDHHGHLRHLHRDQHRQALRGRRHPRAFGRDLAVRGGAVHDLARPAVGTAGRALLVARARAGPQGRVGGGRALLLRDGRHLRRLLHGHRGRGDGRLRSHDLRARPACADLAHRSTRPCWRARAPPPCCS